MFGILVQRLSLLAKRGNKIADKLSKADAISEKYLEWLEQYYCIQMTQVLDVLAQKNVSILPSSLRREIHKLSELLLPYFSDILTFRRIF